jgi:pimeloyl-ACP methyl ester carboxylesterase
MRDWPGTLLNLRSGEVFIRHDPPPTPQCEGVGRERETAGRLEPAVFVHGLGGESLDWADVAALLADRVDGYAVDLPGFGESPPGAGQHTLDLHAAAVVEVIKDVNRGPVHLIGNSLGGSVVTRVAAEHPELVTTLTLVSPAMPDLRPRVWSWQLLIALIPGVGARIVEAALRGDPERMARRVFWLCYGDPHAVTDRRRVEVVAAACRRSELVYSGTVYRSSLRSLVSAYVQLGRRRLWRQAKQVSAPTLLVYGGRDKLVDPRMAKRAAATFPNAHLVLMLDAGHVAHIEFPDRVAATLRDFLDGRIRALDRGMTRAHGTVVSSDAPGDRRAS